jgi:hypothetical protein
VLVEFGGIGAGLARSAVDGGLAFDGPALPGSRSPPDGVNEALDLVVAPPLHLLGALGELGEDLFGRIGHLGQAVLDGLPPDTEPPSQLSPQPRGVERRDRALVVLEGAGVEREPPAVGCHDPVGDHEVGVDLRIVSPAGVLAEGRTDDAVSIDSPDLAVDPIAAVGMILDPPERGRHHPERFSRQFRRKQETYNKANPDEPLPSLKLHGLRHTWATLALQEGIDIHIVSDRLDHSSTHITREIYTHVTKPMQSDAADRVAARILRRGENANR